jgi:predicted transglutaminase-like cysteine proteinase
MARTTNDLASNWEYEWDKKEYVMSDVWRVLCKPEEDGKYRGDCEDFALTWAYIESGESYGKFLLNLLTGKYKVWYVTNNGGGHAVLELPDGKFVDNWSKIAVPKSYMEEVFGHEFVYSFFPVAVYLKLAMGLIVSKIS